MRRSTAAVGSVVWFVLAPGLVAGLGPWWLTGWRVGEAVPFGVVLQVAGAALIVAGIAALTSAFVRFVREGSGTPAPVAPPGRLVVGGLYRYVRNPMYV
ncbi:MAG: isoprenylcysteine carboxyl methyltransferase, partial [Micromonosporaceae bacterium]